MLSPVAVSWMIGKSILENRFGPLARLARNLGWSNPSFFGSPWMAKPRSWCWTPGPTSPS
jgi:multiple sugar transport system permease protein